MSPSLHPMLNVAIRAARAAGAIINRASLDIEAVRISQKQANDFVTEIDHASEAAIIETLLGAYPHHGILAEESGNTHGSAGASHVWVIDPLDGTTNFIHGFPVYCVSIALAVEGRVEQAVIYDPTRNDLFTATRGRGAFMNDRRMRVSRRSHMPECLLSTGFPFRAGDDFPTYLEMMAAIMPRTAGLRRPGAAALDLAYVAAGFTDGFFETGLKPWDMAAGTLLVTEAGGLVGNFAGESCPFDTPECLAANPRVFAQMVSLLKPHSRFGARTAGTRSNGTAAAAPAGGEQRSGSAHESAHESADAASGSGSADTDSSEYGAFGTWAGQVSAQANGSAANAHADTDGHDAGATRAGGMDDAAESASPDQYGQYGQDSAEIGEGGKGGDDTNNPSGGDSRARRTLQSSRDNHQNPNTAGADRPAPRRQVWKSRDGGQERDVHTKNARTGNPRTNGNPKSGAPKNGNRAGGYRDGYRGNDRNEGHRSEGRPYGSREGGYRPASNRADGYRAGDSRMDGYRAGDSRTGGYRAGSGRMDGYRTGNNRADGYRSGGNRTGEYRSEGYRAGSAPSNNGNRGGQRNSWGNNRPRNPRPRQG